MKSSGEYARVCIVNMNANRSIERARIHAHDSNSSVHSSVFVRMASAVIVRSASC